MNFFAKKLGCLCILILLLGGCSNLKPSNYRIDYYTLEYDAPGFDFPTLPRVIRVERFQVAPLYNSNRIVYRKIPYARDTYFYHKWRANPGDLVTYFLTRDIRQSTVFKAVNTYETGLASSHIIEGMVDEFFEDDGRESWEAVLSVSITLVANDEPDLGKRVLFQKKYSQREACRQKNPQALAAAMSKAMAGISETIIKDIYKHLADTL
ncbi:MAG: PqiC family protein [Proteobacteria bacterium]|nr:PqiC family protein [Pseudomonadota bacterium]